MKGKRILFLFLPAITLILELLPYGAVCNFAAAPGEIQRKTYSYFNLIPFGYANFAPFITAILTSIIFLMMLLYCITGKQALTKKAKYMICPCAVVSFGPLLYGIRYFSIVGLLISVSLIAELLLLHFSENKTRRP